MDKVEKLFAMEKEIRQSIATVTEEIYLLAEESGLDFDREYVNPTSISAMFFVQGIIPPRRIISHIEQYMYLLGKIAMLNQWISEEIK